MIRGYKTERLLYDFDPEGTGGLHKCLLWKPGYPESLESSLDTWHSGLLLEVNQQAPRKALLRVWEP